MSVDDSVGQLYAALKDAGQLDNTIIVFMGDNGLLNGEHGMVDELLVKRLPLSKQGLVSLVSEHLHSVEHLDSGVFPERESHTSSEGLLGQYR